SAITDILTSVFLLFSLLPRRPPRPPPFPYTTLFRSPAARFRSRAPRRGRRPRRRRRLHRPGSAARGKRRAALGARAAGDRAGARSEEHTSELQSRGHLVCRLLLEKKKQQTPK